MTELVAVETHRARILAAVSPLPVERVGLLDARGRTLASGAVSLLDIPAFDNSAMDGFAVRFDDVSAADPGAPVTLHVVADVAAGSQQDPALRPGEAARIMTGARVPTDADAIVPFEQTAGGLADSLGEAVVTAAPRSRGAHIRRRAEDLSAGDVALSAGTPLGPLQLSALVSAGVAEVAVTRAPRVAVVSTGSELVPAGHAPGAGQIPDSNSVLLAGLVAEAGCEVIARRSVGDDPVELSALAAELSAGADAIITSGGVSAGAYEPVKQAFGEVLRFDRVAMQPGKPQGFGVLAGGTLLFGLPGNPVSVAASFEMFVRPALLSLLGRSHIDRPRRRYPAATGWRTPARRTQILPAVIDDGGVRPATSGGSGSHLVGGLGRADAYAIVPAEVETVTRGDAVDVMLVT